MPGDDPPEADMFGRHHDHDITVNVDLGQLVGTLADIHRRLDHIDQHQHTLKETLMAELDDREAAVLAAVNDLKDDVNRGLTDLGQKITDLQTQLDNAGKLTADQQAAFDQILQTVTDTKSAVDAADPTAPPV